jgi:hypothetical protein
MSESNGNTQRYRIEQLEKALAGDQAPALLRAAIVALGTELGEVKDELKSLRRGLWAAAGTFALFSLGVFTVIVQRLG